MYTTCFNFGWKIHECVLKYDSDRLQVKQVSNPSLDPGFLGSPLTLIGKQLNSNYTYPNTFQKSKLPIKEPYYRTIKDPKAHYKHKIYPHTRTKSQQLHQLRQLQQIPKLQNRTRFKNIPIHLGSYMRPT